MWVFHDRAPRRRARSAFGVLTVVTPCVSRCRTGASNCRSRPSRGTWRRRCCPCTDPGSGSGRTRAAGHRPLRRRNPPGRDDDRHRDAEAELRRHGVTEVEQRLLLRVDDIGTQNLALHLFHTERIVFVGGGIAVADIQLPFAGTQIRAGRGSDDGRGFPDEDASLRSRVLARGEHDKRHQSDEGRNFHGPSLHGPGKLRAIMQKY